ncbi:MAG: hypothetical protein IIZ20_05110 [Butyrivibrio sp.]|jgi:hypothetical protein|nr:hypothetical protein [Butyrivibrio sp.]
MERKIEVGDIVTLDDGRKVVVTLIHPDSSFEWDLAPDKEPEDKDEKKETVKAKTTKKTSKTTKSKK